MSVSWQTVTEPLYVRIRLRQFNAPHQFLLQFSNNTTQSLEISEFLITLERQAISAENTNRFYSTTTTTRETTLSHGNRKRKTTPKTNMDELCFVKPMWSLHYHLRNDWPSRRGGKKRLFVMHELQNSVPVSPLSVGPYCLPSPKG